jgi:hypothetical protein
MTKFLISVLLTILLATQSMARMEPTDAEVEAYIKQEALRQGFVSYSFPIGVCQVEGRKGNKLYRTGLHGFGKEKVYLPFGIHYSFLNQWDIDDWKVNCRVGVAVLLKKMIAYNGDKTRVLKSYNKKYKYSYRHEIDKIEAQYKTEEQWQRKLQLSKNQNQRMVDTLTPTVLTLSAW